MAMAGRDVRLRRRGGTFSLPNYIHTPTLGLVCTIADNRVLTARHGDGRSNHADVLRDREQWAMGTVT